MREDLIMPRWAVPGVEVSHILYNSGAGLGSAYSEGRRGKITRVLKTQVEVEFERYDTATKTKVPDLKKYKLKRGYRPPGKDLVRVDILEETGDKWSKGHLAPSNGKFVARLRVGKDLLQNTYKMQRIAGDFTKRNSHHVGLADVVKLMEELHEAAKEREDLEVRVLDVDEMPQDR